MLVVSRQLVFQSQKAHSSSPSVVCICKEVTWKETAAVATDRFIGEMFSFSVAY